MTNILQEEVLKQRSTKEMLVDYAEDYNFIRFYHNAFNHFSNTNKDLQVLSNFETYGAYQPKTIFYIMQVFHFLAYFLMTWHARNELRNKILIRANFLKNVIMTMTYVMVIVYIIFLSKLVPNFGESNEPI